MSEDKPQEGHSWACPSQASRASLCNTCSSCVCWPAALVTGDLRRFLAVYAKGRAGKLAAHALSPMCNKD